jgi:aerobic C4-dicarboxylate transport protein
MLSFSFAQVLSIIGILMLTSKGAAGVTGSGFAVLASTLATIKVIPIEGLALLLGVDRFMSEARAITNFIGNWCSHVSGLPIMKKSLTGKKWKVAFSRVDETEDIVKDNIEGETIVLRTSSSFRFSAYIRIPFYIKPVRQ